MDDETLKVVGSVVSLVISILGFIWNIVKDWDKVPVQVRRVLSVVFGQGIAWMILLAISVWFGVSVWAARNPSVYPIEKLPAMTAFLYEGIYDPDVKQGSGRLGVTSDNRDGSIRMEYKLDYNLPKDGEAYAGVSLWFLEPVDLSDYDFIELTISFVDDQARCRLFIKDAFNGKESVLLGDGNLVAAKLSPQIISIPLKTSFSSVAKKAIREIDLDANNAFTYGQHAFTVSKIQFRKQ